MLRMVLCYVGSATEHERGMRSQQVGPQAVQKLTQDPMSSGILTKERFKFQLGEFWGRETRPQIWCQSAVHILLSSHGFMIEKGGSNL